MRSAVIGILVLVTLCEARPSINFEAKRSFGFDPFIIGGTEASPAEFPWQLSQQVRTGVSTWAHNCGASLLSAKYALSASHCLEGDSPSNLRVIAGLHDVTANNGVVANIASYVMHESYEVSETASTANDIAILILATPIYANGGSIQYASLPDDNSYQFTGQSCVMSGWGRAGVINMSPKILRKASINIISTSSCNSILSTVEDAKVDGTQICLYDSDNQIGSCTGDSGGPLTCNYPTPSSSRRVVAGVTSWGISSRLTCLSSYPSVYTRTSAFLPWIKTHTP